MEIRLITFEDWEAIKTIYDEGIQTGNATFQLEAPLSKQWFDGHVLSCSIVCVEEGAIVGWVALSPVSSRDVFSD
jgi:phosphinothricin acetyltransferase